MSVKVMGLVWDLENDQIEQNEKYVLLAYADHASHDGGSIFPGIPLIARKTGYDERSVQRITRSLEEKGFLVAEGGQKGGRGISAHWSIPIKGDKIAPIKIKRVTNYTQKGDTPPVEKGDTAMSPESSLPVPEPSPVMNSETEMQEVLRAADKKVDAYLRMGQMPGLKLEARVDTILSYLGVKLKINTETKRWKDFAKYADARQQNYGEKIEKFVAWMTGQKDFDIKFWSPMRMREMWPQAFPAVTVASTKPHYTGPDEKDYKPPVYVAPPAGLRERMKQVVKSKEVSNG